METTMKIIKKDTYNTIPKIFYTETNSHNLRLSAKFPKQIGDNIL